MLFTSVFEYTEIAVRCCVGVRSTTSLAFVPSVQLAMGVNVAMSLRFAFKGCVDAIKALTSGFEYTFKTVFTCAGVRLVMPDALNASKLPAVSGIVLNCVNTSLNGCDTVLLVIAPSTYDLLHKSVAAAGCNVIFKYPVHVSPNLLSLLPTSIRLSAAF